jgi:hypothetical protein
VSESPTALRFWLHACDRASGEVEVWFGGPNRNLHSVLVGRFYPAKSGRNAGRFCAESHFTPRRKWSATENEARAYVVKTAALNIRRSLYKAVEYVDALTKRPDDEGGQQ